MTVVSCPSIYFEQTIFWLVESRYVVKLGSLDQSSSSIITPTMISTSKNSRCACLFSSNSIRTMATDVVECANLIVFPANYEDGEPSDVKWLIRTRLDQLGAMCKIKPGLKWLLVTNCEERSCTNHTLLKSARRSNSKASRPFHQPSGTSGSLITLNPDPELFFTGDSERLEISIFFCREIRGQASLARNATINNDTMIETGEDRKSASKNSIVRKLCFVLQNWIVWVDNCLR